MKSHGFDFHEYSLRNYSQVAVNYQRKQTIDMFLLNQNLEHFICKNEQNVRLNPLHVSFFSTSLSIKALKKTTGILGMFECHPRINDANIKEIYNEFIVFRRNQFKMRMMRVFNILFPRINKDSVYAQFSDIVFENPNVDKVFINTYESVSSLFINQSSFHKIEFPSNLSKMADIPNIQADVKNYKIKTHENLSLERKSESSKNEQRMKLLHRFSSRNSFLNSKNNVGMNKPFGCLKVNPNYFSATKRNSNVSKKESFKQVNSKIERAIDCQLTNIHQLKNCKNQTSKTNLEQPKLRKSIYNPKNNYLRKDTKLKIAKPRYNRLEEVIKFDVEKTAKVYSNVICQTKRENNSWNNKMRMSCAYQEGAMANVSHKNISIEKCKTERMLTQINFPKFNFRRDGEKLKQTKYLTTRNNTKSFKFEKIFSRMKEQNERTQKNKQIMETIQENLLATHEFDAGCKRNDS